MCYEFDLKRSTLSEDELDHRVGFVSERLCMDKEAKCLRLIVAWACDRFGRSWMGGYFITRPECQSPLAGAIPTYLQFRLAASGAALNRELDGGTLLGAFHH